MAVYKRKSASNFSLCILHNNTPIVSRYFTTEDFNPDVKRSVDLNEIMGDLVEIILEEFKRKDVDYIYDKYNLRDDEFLAKWRNEIKSSPSNFKNKK